MTREELIEKATDYWENYDFNVAGRVIINAMVDFHIEMMKLEDKTVCPKCGSDDNVITLYCNKCGEAY